MKLRKPYLLFLGDEEIPSLAKTAFGLRDWLPLDVVGQWRLTGSTIDLEIPDMEPAAAFAAGARSLVIGVAPAGGKIPGEWEQYLIKAIEAGLDIVSGMHSRLIANEKLLALASLHDVTLHDVRHNDLHIPVATGRKRSGRRLLTVGTDCALGKKYTALSLCRALQEAGCDATFRATGQTGIMIAGEGIAIDAVVADFIAGAAETLTPDAAPEHWDIIEGQGSLFHPAYAGVTLGLIHGSQPDAMVLCHDPRRIHIEMHPGAAIPDLQDAILAYETAARVTNSRARVVAISLNTSYLNDLDARKTAAELEDYLGLPCLDPLRFGAADLAATLMKAESC